jgi:hypothetical protein
MQKHITLCGSMIFLDKMRAIAEELESFGYSVTCPELTEEEKKNGAVTFIDHINSLGGIEQVATDDAIWKVKGNAIQGYKKEIDRSDALLVCNFDKGDRKSRIGDNSFLEMGYAFFTDKTILVLQGPPYGDEKIEEVLGMTPIFLNGDISAIKNIVK